MLPLIVAAVILTAFYQIQLYPADIIAGAVNQLEAKTALIILSAVQGALFACGVLFFRIYSCRQNGSLDTTV